MLSITEMDCESIVFPTAEGDDEDLDSDTDIELEGFDFGKLRKLHPELKSELSDFQNYIVDSTSEMKALKIWQLQDLSYQVAASILRLNVVSYQFHSELQ